MKTASIVLRTNYTNTKGENPVLLVLSAKGESKKFNTGVSVALKHWNKLTKNISLKAYDAQNKNSIISNLLTKANDFILKNSVNNNDYTFTDYCNYVFDVKPEVIKNKTSYPDFAKKYYNLKKITYSAGFYNLCLSELTKLYKYMEVVYIEEMDYNFLQNYEYYMRNTLKNKTNTVGKTFKRMKTVLNEAVRQNVIIQNPFVNHPLKYEKTNRNFLTIEELKTLENTYQQNKLNQKLLNVLQYFLFACYTGLRYTDILELKKENIKTDYIEIIMHKTNEYVRIPLIDNAKLFIDLNNDNIFNVLTNQKTNEYLKLIMLAAGIEKNVSFHTARHTFATISITIGIPIEVISKLMGHNDIRTTNIYAKIVDSKKVSEMAKWNNL